MILELDCGNTLIKWRILSAEDPFPRYAGCAVSDGELLIQLKQIDGLHLRWGRLVSVRSDEETRHILELLSDSFHLSLQQAVASPFCAGVTNGYVEYQLLGLDRWLAILGGFQLAAKACLVIDLGTAITADFVNGQGEHLGGYICPGLSLMRGQLQSHTRRIRYESDEDGGAKQVLLPGRSTAEAVERGCLSMLRSFVKMQCVQAAELLGPDFEVLLTGGDACLVADVWGGAREVPDLVFRGLALACPLARD